MAETEQSIAQTIATFYGERYISFEHQELARLIFQVHLEDPEKEVKYWSNC